MKSPVTARFNAGIASTTSCDTPPSRGEGMAKIDNQKVALLIRHILLKVGNTTHRAQDHSGLMI
jgi:hypothetical protein